jgi:membrane protease YdiL (CAAX protease family)
MAFLPATAALILVWREDGRAAVRDFLKRAVDYRRIPDAGWYALAILFMPGALFLAWLAMTLAGAPLPEPHLPLIALPVFFSMFFAAGLGEELGWQGFAFDRMPERWSALSAPSGRRGTSFPIFSSTEVSTGSHGIAASRCCCGSSPSGSM